MKTRLMNNWFVGLAVGLLLAMSALGWAGPPWGKGGIPAALKACEAALATCEESSFQMPGDGWPENAYPSGGAPLAYDDNGDGTFTDLNTGLMWEIKLARDDPACVAPSQMDRDVHCVNNSYTWSSTGSAFDGTAKTVFLDELNSEFTGQRFAGYDDWRLPTVKELQHLVDYSVPYPGPTVAADLPGATAGFPYSPYWSSTSDALYQTDPYPPDFDAGAWMVYFGDGQMGSFNTNWDLHVRAVRGGR